MLSAMKEQSAGSKQILDAVSQLNALTQTVRDGSEQMLKGSKQVIGESRNLETATVKITDDINTMAAGAEQINSAVSHVSEMTLANKNSADALEQAVARFKVA
jgi:methyl-accepting chemotaxis protein